jgi:hypothetical protein
MTPPTAMIIASTVRQGKFLPITGYEGPEGEYTYTSTPCFNSALDRRYWVVVNAML